MAFGGELVLRGLGSRTCARAPMAVDRISRHAPASGQTGAAAFFMACEKVGLPGLPKGDQGEEDAAVCQATGHRASA